MDFRYAGAIAAAWFAISLIGVQTPATSVTVVGQVVSAVTGAPIAGAEVTLSVDGYLDGQERKATSGEDGRFVFDRVPVGRYYMFASRPGFFVAGLADDSDPGASATLVVSWPGPPLITMKLRPWGRITGTVTDDAGKPVAGANVAALIRQRAWLSWGNHVWWVPAPDVKAAVTDDRGRYVIIGTLPTGDYLIEVDASAIAIPGPVARTFGTMYSPGVHGISHGVPIASSVGDERVADFRLQPMPAFDISGVVDIATVEQTSASIQLFSVEDAMGRERSEIEELRQTGLSFRFSRLPPGEYLLEANSGDQFVGEQRLTIDDRSVTDVHVVLAPPFLVSGRVIWEGVDRPPDRAALQPDSSIVFSDGYKPSPEDVASVAKVIAESPLGLVGILPTGPIPIRNPWVRSSGVNWSADGSFTLRICAGRYLAEGARLNGWFLKSFRINGHEALDEPVEINSNATGAVLTLTRAMGEVRGNIVTATGEPDRGSMAMMFSTNAHVWPGVYGAPDPRFLMVGGDGTDQFTFSNVLPGEYYLAAIPPTPWDQLDEDMLKRLAGSAERVQVMPSASIVRTLRRVR